MSAIQKESLGIASRFCGCSLALQYSGAGPVEHAEAASLAGATLPYGTVRE
jgi:hypothetical protein